MNEVLERWNGLEAGAATEQILPCCGSRAWARAMAERRPMVHEAEVLAAADAAWRWCDEADWREAFATHPRLGEQRVGGEATERSLAWSRQEQGLVLGDEEHTARLLREGNRAYEARFGRTFLVCASWRSGAEVLAILDRRMGNDADAEWMEAGEQQRQITALRLERWMRGG